MNMFLYDYLFAVWEDIFLKCNIARIMPDYYFFLTRVVPLLTFFWSIQFLI